MRCIVATVQTGDCAWLVAEDQETYLGNLTEQMLTSDEGMRDTTLTRLRDPKLTISMLIQPPRRRDGLCGSLFEQGERQSG